MDRWEALSGMGAILPFCGCVANISETMAAALNEGKTIKESIVIAMKSPFYIFGWGIMVCMILAGITHLAG